MDARGILESSFLPMLCRGTVVSAGHGATGDRKITAETTGCMEPSGALQRPRGEASQGYPFSVRTAPAAVK